MVDLPPPRFEGALLLEGGRALGYAEYGPPDGRPILWFHGTPGACRQIAPEGRRAAWERGVRLISVERPGIGASTPHVYRAIVDWARDVEALARALGLGRFGIVGLSGGGPYALACAHELPELVTAVAILGGVAPAVGPDAPPGGAAAITPMLAPILELFRRPIGQALKALVVGLAPFADQVTDLFLRLLPPGDARVFADPATRRMFHEDLQHGCRHHMEALVLDLVLFGRPWGFTLRDVRVPVRLWYGDADNVVPLAHGEHLVRLLPDAELSVRPTEGHLGGLGATHQIFDALLAHAAESASPPTDPDTRSMSPAGS